ncbi:MAG: FAD-dependent oxidoreductase, partial [Phycisphaerales bacterium]
MPDRYEILIVGGGHAGAEAAWAGANLGARVALVTLDASKIGVMSCNPSIGGLAKGQMVREIDALGGLMGLAADSAGINFKVLNASKGPAVRGPRAQCDKHAYAETVQRLLRSRPEIDIIESGVEDLIIEGDRCVGARLVDRADTSRDLRAGAVVLTTGTFMRAIMHTGEARTPGGRHGERAAVGISAALERLGFELGRLKTGTPPRLRRESLDWESLEPQHGDDPPVPFSDLTDPADFPRLEQVACRI